MENSFTFPVRVTISLTIYLLAYLFGSASLQAERAATASITPEDLVEFPDQTEDMQKLIRTALSLTKKNLPYTFGGNSPSKGGMDCSGTVQHTLSEMGISSLPRTSFGFYDWVNTSGKIYPAREIHEISDPAFAALKPGDLLFWEGTYNAVKNDPPVSHVMIYLGTLKEDGKAVMYGASSGRRYRGKKIHGVSVFDFKIPSKKSSAKFIGYGSVPGLINVKVEPSKKQPPPKKGLFEWLGLIKKKANPDKTESKTQRAVPVLPSENAPDLTETTKPE